MVVSFAAQSATAQTHEAAYGELRRIGLPSPVNDVQLLAPSHGGRSVLIGFIPERRLVLRIPVDSSWHPGAITSHVLPVPFDEALVVDRETNGRSLVAFADRAGKRVHLVGAVDGDTLRVQQTIVLPAEPAELAAADITNDRRTDLLVWSRTAPGIMPLVALSNGRFVLRKPIAPENAVGAIATASLNDDDLSDLIVFDWVRSELHMLYGVGNGRFIDQSTFPVNGEVAGIVPLPTPKNSPSAFAVALRSPAELQIWNGTNFGDFSLVQRVPLADTPLVVRTAQTGGGHSSDLLAVLCGGSLCVLTNDDGSISDSLRVTIPCASRVILVSPSAGQIPDVVLSGGMDACWILRNSAQPVVLVDSVDLATGRSPSAVLAADLDRNGRCDAIVACSEDRTIDVYRDRGSLGMSGPVTYPLTVHPTSLVLHHTTDSTVSLLAGSSGDRVVSYLSFSLDGETSSSADIPTEGIPDGMAPFPGERGMPGLAVLSALSSDDRFSMSVFEQVSGERFLEQSFRLSAPNVLLGASTSDLNRDGYPGIIYSYRASDTTAIDIAAAFGDSLHSLRHHAVLQELPVRKAQQVRTWVADFDGDDTLDILVYCSAPASQFFLLRGRANGAFDSPLALAQGLEVREQGDVRLWDVDRDGVPEVVVLDRSQARIVWFRAAPAADHGLHAFLDHRPIQAFDIGDFNGDGIPDVAVVMRDPALLRLYSGAGRWDATAKTGAEENR